MNIKKAWLKEVEHDPLGSWQAGPHIICIVPILATSKKEP
jgi:hypothetical protein